MAKIQLAISPADHLICSMFGSRMGFSGQWIEWRYFRFDQIRDGFENSNGDISAAD